MIFYDVSNESAQVFATRIELSKKEIMMEYLDIVREAKESMEHIYMVMKQAGCFKHPKIRLALVEYHLLKTIGTLSVLLGDLEDDNNNQTAVSQMDTKEMPTYMQDMRIQ